MNKFLFIIFFAFLLLGCNPGPSESHGPVISKEKLRAHISILASDDMKGRKTNEEGYLKAADYVTDQLRETGLQPFFPATTAASHDRLYFEQVPFVEYTYGDNNWLKLSNPTEKVNMHNGYIILNPGDLNGVVRINSLFYAGYGIYEPELEWDDFSDADVRDKFVMIVDGQPDKDNHPEIYNLYEKSPQSLARRIERLKELKVAGLIIVSEMGEKYWDLSALIQRKLGYNPVDPSYMGDPYDPEFPVIMIKPSLFRNHFHEIPLTISKTNYPEHNVYPVEIELSVEVKKRLFSAPNVAGFIPGTDSILASQFVILSAHLDHIGTEGDKIFNGANDNASSCAVLLEVASSMVKSPPSRTVIFVFYTAEEPCLWGSNYFIRHFPFLRDDILLNVNVEMVGKNDKNFQGFTAIGPVEFEPSFRINSPAKVRYRDYREHRMKFRGSDQLSFFLHDVDAVRFGNLDYPEKHTERDDISIIDFDHVRDAAVVLYKVTGKLVESPR